MSAFHEADIPVVIATTRPIADHIAREFAEHFYRELVDGHSIRIAFEQAENKLLILYKNSQELYRGFKRENEWEDLDHPYTLHIHSRYPDAGEARLADWQEKEIAGETLEAPQIISPEAYLLCDRHVENTQFDFNFRPFIKVQTRKPKFFIIHGPNIEEPVSLARRFMKFTVPDIYSIHKGRIRTRTKRPWVVDLPEKSDFEHKDKRMPEYQRDIQFQNKFRLRKVNAREIVRKMGKNLEVAFIQHNLMAAH